MSRNDAVAHSDLVCSVLQPSGALSTGVIDDPRITDSWERCLLDYNLDPSKAKTDHRIIEQAELSQRREQKEFLLRAAEAELENLYNQISGSGSCVLLADAEGTILQGLFDPSLANMAMQAGLRPGAVWSEHYEGTNGIGTAISNNQPITIYLHEHFNSRNIGLTCSGAPIIDPDGEVAGIVDVSSTACVDSRRVQQHTLALVSMTAKVISNRIFLDNFRDDFLLRFHSRREFVGLLCEGILALDPNGRIKACNDSALAMLDNGGRQEIIGKRADELFDGESQRLLNKAIHDPFSPVQIRDRAQGRAFFAIFQIPKSSGLKVRSKPGATTNVKPARRANLSGYLDLDDLAGRDPKMQYATECARRVMNRQIPIVINGETGTGKEAIARAIHNASDRASESFVAINCAAIPENLIESELFGYKGGAFTGARKEGCKGKILQANGGTLFLDEIGDMPLELQTRLLRVLEEREVLPVGAEVAVPVNFDVIVATHRDIAQLVGDGDFRQDLFYRLNGITLVLPPLRERADVGDVILKMLDFESNHDASLHFSPQAMAVLEAYAWPGNIRQLRNVVRVALALRDGDIIGVEALPAEVTQADMTAAPSAPLRPNPAPQAPAPAERLGKGSIAEAERQALLEELHNCRWNVTLAAKKLGMSRATLYRKMKKHQILENDNE